MAPVEGILTLPQRKTLTSVQLNAVYSQFQQMVNNIRKSDNNDYQLDLLITERLHNDNECV